MTATPNTTPRSASSGAARAEGPAAASDEYEEVPVPAEARRGLFSVSAVWVGFPMILTCAVFGGMIVFSLGFWHGMLAIGLGNLVLMLYVGSLSALAGRTGCNFALTAVETFGSRGYRVPSAFLATVVIGWFAFQTGLTGSILHDSFGWDQRLVTLLAGVAYLATTLLGIRALSVIGMVAAPVYLVLGSVAVGLAASRPGAGPLTAYPGGAGTSALSLGAAVTLVIATFIDSGTMTADFTRWSRSARQGFVAALTAFPIANTVAMVVGGLIVALGAASDPAHNGGSFLPILIAHGGVLVPVAAAFVLINLGSVCTHCLYNGAVGWAQLTGTTMRRLTVMLGALGVVLAVLGIWSYFEQWLNLLGVIVPPIGIVIILDQLVFAAGDRAASRVRWASFAGWGCGSAAALLCHLFAPWLSDAVIGMVVAGAVFAVLSRSTPGRVPASPR